MGLSSAFATTRWSLVADAAGRDPDARRAALGEFARLYRAPCEAWLRLRGVDRERAEETVQNFLVDVVLERGLLAKVEPGAGPLRARVLHALRNHATDLFRRRAARGRHEVCAAEWVRDAGTAMSGGGASDDSFDAAWASAQLQEALARGHARAMQAGRGRDWRAFERHVLLPAVHGTRKPLLADLAREVGIADAARVSVVIREIRMLVLRALDEVVTETARDPGDVQAERAHIRAILGVGRE
jgi:hypothetical protein